MERADQFGEADESNLVPNTFVLLSASLPLEVQVNFIKWPPHFRKMRNSFFLLLAFLLSPLD